MATNYIRWVREKNSVKVGQDCLLQLIFAKELSFSFKKQIFAVFTR